MDLCNIPRISVRMKSKRFLEKIFVETEIAFAFSKARPEQHLAGFYAAREALSKALTLGLWRMGLKMPGLFTTRKAIRDSVLTINWLKYWKIEG